MRSQIIVGATLAVDAALFLALLIVGVISGSKAVLSQAIYVVADLIGAGLLTWGIIASMRPPDERHPFGRGKERFFWSFSASLVTFTLAGFIVIISGLNSVAHPSQITDLGDVFLVLILTVASSLVGIFVTLRELRREGMSVNEFLDSSNLGLKTIFYQDLVSVFGALVALTGILLIALTHRAIFDGLAAVGVGVLLSVTGVLLAGESRELLVGKAISPGEARRVLDLVEKDARVRKVRGLQSMMLGPEDILVALRVNFQDGLTTDQIEGAIDQISRPVARVLPDDAPPAHRTGVVGGAGSSGASPRRLRVSRYRRSVSTPSPTAIPEKNTSRPSAPYWSYRPRREDQAADHTEADRERVDRHRRGPGDRSRGVDEGGERGGPVG